MSNLSFFLKRNHLIFCFDTNLRLVLSKVELVKDQFVKKKKRFEFLDFFGSKSMRG